MNEYEAALDDVMGEDWEQTAYEEGMQNAVEDTARQAARFDNHFGDDSARYIRSRGRGRGFNLEELTKLIADVRAGFPKHCNLFGTTLRG